MVPETGEVLSSSKANFLDAFRLGTLFNLAFLTGVPELLLGEVGGGLFKGKGLKGGDPSPISFMLKSTPGGADLGPGESRFVEAAMAAALAKM